MKKTKKYLIIVSYILLGIVFGYYVASSFNTVTPISKDFTPSFWTIFITNLGSSVILMVLDLIFGFGIFGVTYLAFNLGMQFYSVVLAYGEHNFLNSILILSIHGIFEIAVMALIISVGLSILKIWKDFLFRDSKSIMPGYKSFFKNEIISKIVLVFVYLLVGGILETSISARLFKLLV